MSLLKLIRWSQCVQDTVIERAELCRDEGQLVLTARVRPARHRRSRCSRCGRRCPGYDNGGGLRVSIHGWVPLMVQAVAGSHGLPARAARVASMARTPWLRALTR